MRILEQSELLDKMCNLPQCIADVLDRVPMRELEEYLDDRKGKQAAPVKREAGFLIPKIVKNGS